VGLAGALALPTATLARPVDLELILAVDTSSSVNYEEYALQMAGYAQAFRNPALLDAVHGAGENGIAVTLVQWASVNQQRVSIGWTHIANAADAALFAALIESAPRYFSFGSTAIGEMIRRAAPFFKDNGFEGSRLVIDVSGDGRANQGLPPEMVRDAAVLSGITINGLAILNEQPGLDIYYRRYVSGGWSSFVMPAQDYTDFAEAILAKLIREVNGAPISGTPAAPSLAAAPSYQAAAIGAH
jgi:hypothetical protein